MIPPLEPALWPERRTRVAELVAGSKARARARARVLELVLAAYALEHHRCPTCLQPEHPPSPCTPPPIGKVLAILELE